MLNGGGEAWYGLRSSEIVSDAKVTVGAGQLAANFAIVLASYSE